jgi:hypothetical protein
LPRPYGPAADIGAYEYMPSFTIQGQITGFPTRNYSVSAGIFYNVTDSSGNFTLMGVVASNYSVIPSAPGFLFVPASQSVTVGPNATNINFTAYQFNALSIEGVVNGMLQLAFAGTSGQTEVLQSSTNFTQWTPVSTNIVGSNGIFVTAVTNDPAQAALFLRTQAQ